LHETALAKLRTQLGDEHPTTLVTVNNLGRAYEAAGRLAEAIRLNETTMEKLQSRLGPEHPTTLTSMHGLAQSYQKAGQLDKAIALFETTLAKRRGKLGASHHESLRTTFQLAAACAAARHDERAALLAREFLELSTPIAHRLPDTVRKLIPQADTLLQHLRKQAHAMRRPP
jgi:tetratricopeptide (TPR) repeat protein